MVVARDMVRFLGTAFLTTALVVPAIGAADVAWSDQTASAELFHFTGTSLGMTQRQMFPGGAVADFNRDGWPDVFLLGGGVIEDALFINDGDGTFTESASAWGLVLVHYGRGATAGDFNSDGWPDLYVTTGGPEFADEVGKHMLYRNNGNGTFTNIAVSAGVNRTSFSGPTATGSAFGDYDLDGDLDLFVCGWEGTDGNRLFRNNGNETFTDVTTTVGVAGVYYGFSPRFVDMNGDRYPEILISADYGTSRYFVNDGDGTFTNYTTQSDTGHDHNGMGGAIADFNRDGLPDWYVTSIYDDTTYQDGNYLYVNQGNHVFATNPESSGARNGGWGWGVDTIDIDHDGWVDLVETNGWPPPQWDGENSYMWRNNGDLTFTEVQGVTSGFDHITQGRSLMKLDYDRDGDMDVVLAGWEEDAFLFRNDVSGSDAHWLEVFLDTSGHAGLAPDGYGARVIATVAGVPRYEWITGGATYLGRSQPVAHFGLGTATVVDQLRVEWPNGAVTTLNNVAADQIMTVTPSSGGSPGAPGEASAASPMTASRNGVAGMVDVTFAPACDATDHTIYWGDLSQLASYTYTGAACGVGTSGTASFDSGPGDVFFVVVGTAASAEGSYGLDGVDAERPEDIATAGCDLDQDLTGTCVP